VIMPTDIIYAVVAWAVVMLGLGLTLRALARGGDAHTDD
jgi:hypothetical protein